MSLAKSHLTSGVSPKPMASSRKSDKKREEIIRAAIEIINAKSYVQATMTEIAASLDLRDAALYYYYPSKQALVYACHIRSLERFESLLEEADLRGGAGIEKLRTFLRSMLDDSERNGPQLYFGDHSYLEAAECNAVDAWADRLKGVLERFVEEGIADRSIVPCEPQLVVQLIVGMLIWLGKWVPGVEGLTVDRLMDAITLVSLRGLAAEASKRQRL